MFTQLFSNQFNQTNIALAAILAKLETIYPYDTPKTTKDSRSENPSKTIPIMDIPQTSSNSSGNNIAA